MHPDIKRPGTVASIEDLEFREEILKVFLIMHRYIAVI